MSFRVPVVLLFCVGIMVGCSGTDAEVFSPVDAAPSDPAPGEEVLEVQTSGSTITYSLADLERDFELYQGTVLEPFEERELAFTGVLLRDVLSVVNAGEANEVELVALDDYHVVFDLDQLQGRDALLATRQGGDLIPVDTGGPIRVVFTATSELGANPDLWIWSVASMELR